VLAFLEKGGRGGKEGKKPRDCPLANLAVLFPPFRKMAQLEQSPSASTRKRGRGLPRKDAKIRS